MVATKRVLAAMAMLSAMASAAGQPGTAEVTAPWSASAAEGISVVWPAGQAKVTFQGVVNIDGAGMGPGGMVYPAPNVAGFLVAILTHAAINETVKNSQKASLQAGANKVLADYASAIDGLTPEELLRRTAAALRSTVPAVREGTDAEWSLEVLPLFRMTQDRRALIVDNVVSVRARGTSDVVRRSAVRVVADPRPAEGVSTWWSDKDGEALKAEAANLLAQAIHLSVIEMGGRWEQSTAPHRTIRFAEGGEERIERAQVLDQQCGRAVVRTLRGDLLAVPLWAREADAAVPVCGAPSAPAAATGN